MRGRKVRKVSTRLLRLKQRFAAWRKGRKHGQRIPQRLWNAAAKLACEYGVSQTSKVLNLDYYTLKKHVGQQMEQSASSPAFLELPSSPLPGHCECLIEFDDGRGSSMRVHLKGADVPDILAFSDGFWNAE